MTIAIKPTASGSTIEQDGSTILTVDGSGNLTVANNLTVTGTAPSVDALSTASGSAPSYSARLWVNFNGTGTIAIRDDGNVSSLTDNGTGDYTVSFTTALPDTNYCVTGHANHNTTADNSRMFLQSMTSLRTTSSIRVRTRGDGGTAVDSEVVDIAIFR
jgi:hypothetical protein